MQNTKPESDPFPKNTTPKRGGQPHLKNNRNGTREYTQVKCLLFSETVPVFHCAGNPSGAEGPSRNVSEDSAPASDGFCSVGSSVDGH